MISSRREIVRRLEEINRKFREMGDSNRMSNLPVEKRLHRLEEICFRVETELTALRRELEENPKENNES